MELMSRIDDIMKQNSSKEFVKRAMVPEAFPSIDNGNGSISTHLMNAEIIDGRWLVFPSIVTTENGLKNLVDGEDKSRAVDYALKTGEYIEFGDADEAIAFSQQYKEYGRKPKMERLADVMSGYASRENN